MQVNPTHLKWHFSHTSARQKNIHKSRDTRLHGKQKNGSGYSNKEKETAENDKSFQSKAWGGNPLRRFIYKGFKGGPEPWQKNKNIHHKR